MAEETVENKGKEYIEDSEKAYVLATFENLLIKNNIPEREGLVAILENHSNESAEEIKKIIIEKYRLKDGR